MKRRTGPSSGVAAKAVAAAALIGLTSCSSSKSAAAKVCDARAKLQSSVDTIRADVRNGNLGEARDGMTAVQDDFDNLKAEVTDLKSEEKTKLQPQIDAITQSLANLKDATSLSELGTSAQTVSSQFQTLAGDLKADLDCT